MSWGDGPLKPLPPVHTMELFAPLHAELMSLLEGLTPEDWERPTLARAWRVKDVAAHLLDTQLRKLSAQRDGHLLAPDREIRGTGDLVALLNDLNAAWVSAARR
ncbi:MAG TPA: maleylpyruvate isomerase N-terminal domain-containing protein, partial [Thermoanaerobaculia bacterium]|nr:maleylpyruvate isomerase N-terminal domain-containing protein [Thermoanaerobaculia bacterium]